MFGKDEIDRVFKLVLTYEEQLLMKPAARKATSI